MRKLGAKILVLIGLGLVCGGTGEVAGSERVKQFKEFFKEEHAAYRIVFAREQYATAKMKKAMKKLRKAGNKRVLNAVNFGKRTFHKVVTGKDGYLHHRAKSSRSALETFELSDPREVVRGAVSNRYWSAKGGGVLAFDLQALDEKGWRERAAVAGSLAIRLGLEVQKGTVEWNGDKFRAKAMPRAPVPRDKWGMEITGTLKTEGGVPSSVEYGYGRNRMEVSYDYDKTVGPGLPGAFEIVTELLKNGGSEGVSHFRYDILDFDVEDENPGTNVGSPSRFIEANPAMTVIEKDGEMTRTLRHNGKWVNLTAWERGERSVVAWLAGGLLGLLVILPLVIVFRRKVTSRY